MLERILQSIDGKAQDEIAKLLAEKERAICNLEKQHQKDLEEKREKALEGLKNRAQAEIEEFKQKTCLAVKFKLQEEKNRIVKNVYERAKEEVAQLSDERFEKVIRSFLVFFPKALEGKVLAGERTAQLLRRSPLKRNFALGDTLPEEGFILKTKELEIDARVSQMLNQNREKTDPEVMKILF